MHVHNGQNIQKIPTKVEIFKISLQIRIVYVPNKTVYRGKFTKIRVACIHGYSGLKSSKSIVIVNTTFLKLTFPFTFIKEQRSKTNETPSRLTSLGLSAESVITTLALDLKGPKLSNLYQSCCS